MKSWSWVHTRPVPTQSLDCHDTHLPHPDRMDRWEQSSPFSTPRPPSSRPTSHPCTVPCPPSRQPSISAAAVWRATAQLLKDSGTPASGQNGCLP